eukprot:2540842-Rhodomonas_salina.1
MVMGVGIQAPLYNLKLLSPKLSQGMPSMTGPKLFKTSTSFAFTQCFIHGPYLPVHSSEPMTMSTSVGTTVRNIREFSVTRFMSEGLLGYAFTEEEPEAHLPTPGPMPLSAVELRS